MAGPALQLYRLIQRCTFNGLVTCINTMHFVTGDELATAQQLCDDWRNNIVPTWQGITCDWYRFNTVSAHRIIPDAASNGSTEINLNGQLPSVPLTSGLVGAPVVCAGLVTWRSNIPGRSGRGRIYLAGMQYQVGSGVTWAGPQLTTMGTLATAIRNRYTPAGNPYGMTLCVWSRKIGGTIPPYNTDGIRTVTSHTIQQYIGTMGTRRYGRGL